MKPNLAIYYCTYPALMLLVTLLLGRALWLKGKWLQEEHGSGRYVQVSRLLIAGLFVVSAGYLILTTGTSDSFVNMAQLIEMETVKLGFGVMLLGALFSFDLLVLVMASRTTVMRQARVSELR